MATDPARVKALFQAAIELTDPGDRAAFVGRETAGDPELRGRLDALLAAYDRPHGALDRPLGGDSMATGPTAAEADAGRLTRSHPGDGEPPLLDTVIAGRYRLRQLIGEGGMGAVYLADQTHPVRRRVAVKLIKAGMDSRQVLARFDAKRYDGQVKLLHNAGYLPEMIARILGAYDAPIIRRQLVRMRLIEVKPYSKPECAAEPSGPDSANPVEHTRLILGKRVTERGGAYWLDGRPVSSKALIQEANRMQARDGLAPFGPATWR